MRLKVSLACYISLNWEKFFADVHQLANLSTEELLCYIHRHGHSKIAGLEISKNVHCTIFTTNLFNCCQGDPLVIIYNLMN